MTNNLILVFVLGLAVGSFLNVVIYRINDLKSIFFSRSICRHCKTVLAWRDLVPLLSFVLLKAKCRYCKKPLSWQYPLVEFGTALVFVWLYLAFGLSWAYVFYLLIFLCLIVVLVYDLKTQLVPEEFVWPVLFLSLLGGWYFGGFKVTDAIWGAIIGGGSFALLVYVSKERWMGKGDIKIGLIMGLLLGYPVIIAGLLLAFILGSIAGLGLIVAKGKKMKDALPFTPFLILSLLLSLIYGRFLVSWYLLSFWL